MVVALALAAAGCREAAEPFRPPDEPPPAGLRRLTANPGDDRSPAWSPAGDSVYYSAEAFGDLPQTEGVLLAVAREGGVAVQLLPTVQIPGGAPRTLLTPATAPDGERLAYVQILTLLSGRLCSSGGVECTPATPEGEVPRAPRLDRIALRVRALTASGPIADDPSLEVGFEGRGFDEVRGVFLTDYHPFQRLFDEELLLPFGPSWAPAADRLVFADGLRLLVWRPGEASAVQIAGSADGASAAWSPDGTWIAYTRLERVAETGALCEYFSLSRTGERFTICLEERREWPVVRRRVALIRPDGSETRELGEGEEPAWTPDGTELVLRRGGGLWRVRADGGGEAPVPGTEGGREPAVSPDGSEVAFARRGVDGTHDIWVAPLP